MLGEVFDFKSRPIIIPCIFNIHKIRIWRIWLQILCISYMYGKLVRYIQKWLAQPWNKDTAFSLYSTLTAPGHMGHWVFAPEIMWGTFEKMGSELNLSQWWFNQVVILILYKPYLERWIKFKLYLERMIQFDYLYFNNTYFNVLKPPLNVQVFNGVAVWLILLDKIHKNVLIAVDVVYIYIYHKLAGVWSVPTGAGFVPLRVSRVNLDQKSCHDEGW